jgi:osmotically-inducible protein OsmY
MEGQNMEDKIIRQLIIDELDFEPSVNAANIGVAVERGVVTLTGHTGSYAEKHAVERAVQRIKGVRAIAEEIAVRYSNEKKTADDQVAERALKIIAWNATLPDDAIKVQVTSGWVTLNGTVEWNYQRLAAEAAVRKLRGVIGVSNQIVVKPRVQASDIKVKILAALKRDAELEADAIRVDVDGSKVVLEGKVKAWRERVVAERTAWAAPGVTSVIDNLCIV